MAGVVSVAVEEVEAMRKASRLFEIIQILRLARTPLTAAEIAERMEVAPRSIYRDIAALQAMRVPIEGARGIGYILRPGFTLPPLMFTIEEVEAIVLGLELLKRAGDTALKAAAGRVAAKTATALPEPLRDVLDSKAIHAWGTVAKQPTGIDLALVRHAIRAEQKIDISYRDEGGRDTQRTVRPIALIYYSDATNIVAWCQLRGAIRHFRAERVQASEALDEFFKGEGERLRRLWMEGWKSDQGDQR